MPEGIIRILGLGYFLGCGYVTVRRLIAMPPLSVFLLSPLVSIAPLTIIGSVFYLLGSLSTSVIATLLWIPLVIAVLSTLCIPPITSSSHEEILKTPRWKSIGICLYILLITAFLVSIGIQQTTDSLLGPWDHISPISFVLYFLATAVLATILYGEVQRSVALAGIGLHFFASISVALIRFPLGFGFDPILHAAAERLVVEQGVVMPKTFYYVGQYVLIPFLSRVFMLPVEWFGQLLLPLLIAVSVPVLGYEALKHFFQADHDKALLIVLALLMIPYEYTIMTTPWSIAYNTILLTVMSSMIACGEGKNHMVLLAGTLGIFALTLHPLAGIPLILFLLMCVFYWLKNAMIRRTLLGSGVILSTISIPLAFWANSLVSEQFQLTLALPDLSDRLWPSSNALLQTRFMPLLDAVYFIYLNGWLFFMAFVAIGVFLLLFHQHQQRLPNRAELKRHVLIVCFLIAASLSAAALITGELIRFNSLASFEQQDYAKRLVAIADLFLLPFAAYTLMVLLHRFDLCMRVPRMVFPLVIAGVISASLYLSYPRNDAYTPFHGYTVSTTDSVIARFIDTDSGGIPFIVLANQVVASASIREFGFKKYFERELNGKKESIFYYPIPSGSPLAPFYYRMLSSPSRETMQAAMDRVGVNRSYFVVRDYEPRFPIIVRDGKKSADEWYAIDEGKAYVFMYSSGSGT